MNGNKFTPAGIQMRWGCSRDHTDLTVLLSTYAMATDVDPAEFLLAEKDGEVAGAARLEWMDQEAYLRPIVVASGAQRKGIGRALVEALLVICPDFRVVSRGGMVPFYKGLGFVNLDWAGIPRVYEQECELCADRSDCRPEVLIKRSAKAPPIV
jgi:N-acetylglutamate synthase-like GNAT family acetyltransferase